VDWAWSGSVFIKFYVRVSETEEHKCGERVTRAITLNSFQKTLLSQILGEADEEKLPPLRLRRSLLISLHFKKGGLLRTLQKIADYANIGNLSWR
jgi:hypothetical protein